MVRNLEQMLQEEIRTAGFELYDWSLRPGGKRGLMLRISVHSDKGVNLDHCAAVSRALGRALDKEELIEGRYVLEVSSPGMDRPLVSRRHFEIALGLMARVQERLDEGNVRDLEGKILSLENDTLVLNVQDNEERVALKNITKARLVPQFPGRNRKSAGPTGGKK
jgi:ribosome maturation factor RimP